MAKSLAICYLRKVLTLWAGWAQDVTMPNIFAYCNVFMLKTIVIPVIVAVGSMLLSTQACADDLMTVFQHALASAPSLKADKAQENASLEVVPISVSALLPQVSLGADIAANDTSSLTGNGRYNSTIYSAQLTQTLINFNSFANVHSAMHSADSARSTYGFQFQKFIVTVAQAYFNVLEARDNVTFAKSKEMFLQKTLIQTREKHQVGLNTITDLKQAESSYYEALALRVKAVNNLAVAREKLTELTGYPTGHLANLQPDFPFTMPMPDDINQWARQAVKYNRNLAAAQYTAEARFSTALSAAGSQLPSLNVNIGYTDTRYSANVPSAVSSVPNQRNAQIELALSWNIFSGGALWATTLQAAKQYVASRATANLTYRQVVSSTRQDYLSVETAINRIIAFRQAVVANQSALEQFQARYKVGIETIIGVLNQVQALFNAKQQLAQAEYKYIIAVLTLQQDAGMLTVSNLAKINRWL